ncbi:MAG: chemotaxis protein CheW [Hyphomonadaceae bacterium]
MSEQEYVTFRIGGQIFGASVSEIQDVFSPVHMTPVPKAAGEIAGVLNLRGRIVTAICARARLGLPDLESDAPEPLAIGVERDGENFGIIIDAVGEVLRLDEGDLEENPVNLDRTWASVSKGVYRLENTLLVIMDIDRMLASPDAGEQAAA